MGVSKNNKKLRSRYFFQKTLFLSKHSPLLIRPSSRADSSPAASISRPTNLRQREVKLNKTAKSIWKYFPAFCADCPLTVDTPSGIVSSTNARMRSSKRGKPFQRSVGWCKTQRRGFVELAAERLCRRSSRCRRECPLQCRDMIVSYRVIPFCGIRRVVPRIFIRLFCLLAGEAFFYFLPIIILGGTLP